MIWPIVLGTPHLIVKISKYETPALWAGEEYFKLFEWLISSFEAIFGSAILRTPTGWIESASKIEPVRVYHNNTEPLAGFEAEPHDGGSTRGEDAYSF